MNRIRYFLFLCIIPLIGCVSTPSKISKTPAEKLSAQEIYANNCAGCHGGNLQGGLGPNILNLKSRLNKKEILDIMENGRGRMPAQNYLPLQQRLQLAEWLMMEK